MGLVLAAVAVQFVIRGVESVLPELAAVMRATPRI
jgi:small neutral amino acid transporter SnatA (MarC family)